MEEQYGKKYSGTFSIKLEDGKTIDQVKDDEYQRVNTLQDLGINRFSTIKFKNPVKITKEDYDKAADRIIIYFPDYLKHKQMQAPYYNVNFQAGQLKESLYDSYMKTNGKDFSGF